MLVATCLLASSLFTCEWHRPGTAPRLRPKPVEIAALPHPGYAAFPDPATALPPVAGYPAVEYNESVTSRIDGVDPHPERFGRLAYLMPPPPVIYGDYPDMLADTDLPEKPRKGRKRETLAETVKPRGKKTKSAGSPTQLAYASPSEPRSWLSSIFGGKLDDEAPKAGPSTSGAGYDAVRSAARKYGPGGSKFEKLAQDITYTESRGRCGAVSSAKALGVMQTKYGTAKMMGYKGTAEGLKNCHTGAEWGVKYLAYCHDLADGDVRLTSVCYNQGHGVLTNPRKYGKRAERKEAVNYIATMRSRGWRM